MPALFLFSSLPFAVRRRFLFCGRRIPFSAATRRHASFAVGGVVFPKCAPPLSLCCLSFFVCSVDPAGAFPRFHPCCRKIFYRPPPCSFFPTCRFCMPEMRFSHDSRESAVALPSQTPSNLPLLSVSGIFCTIFTFLWLILSCVSANCYAQYNDVRPLLSQMNIMGVDEMGIL